MWLSYVVVPRTLYVLVRLTHVLHFGQSFICSLWTKTIVCVIFINVAHGLDVFLCGCPMLLILWCSICVVRLSYVLSSYAAYACCSPALTRFIVRVSHAIILHKFMWHMIVYDWCWCLCLLRVVSYPVALTIYMVVLCGCPICLNYYVVLHDVVVVVLLW